MPGLIALCRAGWHGLLKKPAQYISITWITCLASLPVAKSLISSGQSDALFW